MNFIGSTRGGFTGSPTYPDPTFDRDHEGHWGWRADEVLRDLPTWLTKYTPGIALVHLGSNDAFQGNPPDGTIDELRRIIGLLRGKNPRVAVLLAKILPTVHPDNNTRFTMVNDRIPALASELHTADAPVIVVDHNTDFDVAALTYDGIHPNEAGEKLMAGRWWKALEPLLRAAGPCP